jgi:hypothetical protein
MISKKFTNLCWIYLFLSVVLKFFNFFVLSTAMSIFVEKKLKNLLIFCKKNLDTISVSFFLFII